MNNKFIIPALIIVALGVILYFHISLLRPSVMVQSNPQNIVFISLVKGCAETDSGMATKSFGGAEQTPKIEIKGSEIIYSRALNHLCCRKVNLSENINGSTINIYETWSGMGCKCICFSKIEARLDDVPTGNYLINVYERGTKPSSYPMKEKVIISKHMTIE